MPRLSVIFIIFFLPLPCLAQEIQRFPASESASDYRVPQPRDGDVTGTVLGGLLGGAGGGLAVATAFAVTCKSDPTDDLRCLGPVATGLLLGWGVGTAIGAHLGNDARGNLGTDILVSFTAIFAGAAISSFTLDNDAPLPMWFLIPAAQVGVVASVEISAGRARARLLPGAVQIRF